MPSMPGSFIGNWSISRSGCDGSVGQVSRVSRMSVKPQFRRGKVRNWFFSKGKKEGAQLPALSRRIFTSPKSTSSTMLPVTSKVGHGPERSSSPVSGPVSPLGGPVD
jgi:hypothetical protein